MERQTACYEATATLQNPAMRQERSDGSSVLHSMTVFEVDRVGSLANGFDRETELKRPQPRGKREKSAGGGKERKNAEKCAEESRQATPQEPRNIPLGSSHMCVRATGGDGIADQ